MHATGISDIGLLRESNQDTFLIEKHMGLYVVCDGMGGHKGGDVASNLAIKAINESLDSYDSEHALKWLNQCVIKANQLIREWGRINPELFEMGTTLTAALIKEQDLIIAHVGDSRLYRINQQGIIQLTRDHTLAQQMISDGLLKPEELRDNAYNHILTRALGIADQIIIDNLVEQLLPGDIILLCTDGLSDMVEESDILTIINEYGKDLEGAAQKMLDCALSNGGYDNITLILIRV
jgi:serine/threonine protein phosphatase PrpC